MMDNTEPPKIQIKKGKLHLKYLCDNLVMTFLKGQCHCNIPLYLLGCDTD